MEVVWFVLSVTGLSRLNSEKTANDYDATVSHFSLD
jgi:hypothetical protein